MRPLCLAVGIVGIASAASLATYFSFGGPFGTLNDVGNAALGVLSAGLAWRLTREAAPARGTGWAVIASTGAAITVVGSGLVVSGTTGFTLAGLVSTIGFGLIGLWLVVVNWSGAAVPASDALARFGMLAGVVMASGLASIPVVATGIDDLDALEPWMWAGFTSWLAVYALYPIWALGLRARANSSWLDRDSRSRQDVASGSGA